VTFLEFNQCLGAAAQRMEPAEAARLLTEAMNEAPNPMARGRFAGTLAVVAGRMESRAASDTCEKAARRLLDDLAEAKHRFALSQTAIDLTAVVTAIRADQALPLLTEGIAKAEARAAVVRKLQAKGDLIFEGSDLPGLDDMLSAEAARRLAAALPAVAARAEPNVATRLLKEALVRATDAEVRRQLVTGLAAAARRIDSRLAADVCGPVARQFADAVVGTNDPIALAEVARGLVTLAEWLAPTEADKACRLAAQKLTDALAGQPLLPDTIPTALKALARHMPPDDAARMLTAVVGRVRDTHRASSLRHGLGEAALRMPPEKGTRLLVETLEAATDPFAQADLAVGLAAVAEKMERSAAAKACAPVARRFSQIIARSTDLGLLAEAARALVALTARMDPAAGKDACRTAAGILADAIIRSPDRSGARMALAKHLGALAQRIDPTEAASLLVGVMNQTPELNAVPVLAFGIAEVAGRLEPGPAAEVCGNAARFLTATRAKVPDPQLQAGFDAGLVAISGLLPPDETSRLLNELLDRTLDPRAATAWNHGLTLAAIGQTAPRMGTSVNATLLALGSFGPPDSWLAGLPLLHPRFHKQSRPLSQQQLIDLLKHPLCIGETRRSVLQALAFTHDRPFADQWDFVRYIRDKKVDVDLLAPFNRPTPAWEFGQFLRPGNIPFELFQRPGNNPLEMFQPDRPGPKR
jgi:hypothetical protein